MKRLVSIASALCLAAWLGPAAFAAANHPAVPGEANHHLLQLDQKDAMDHARALHHMATHQAKDMDLKVAREHVAEIDKNLKGAEEQITLSSNAASDEHRKLYRTNYAELRRHDDKAMEYCQSLQTEIALATPDPAKIAADARGVYDELRQAQAHHMTIMRTRGVHEAEKPAPETKSASNN